MGEIIFTDGSLQDFSDLQLDTNHAVQLFNEDAKEPLSPDNILSIEKNIFVRCTHDLLIQTRELVTRRGRTTEPHKCTWSSKKESKWLKSPVSNRRRLDLDNVPDSVWSVALDVGEKYEDYSCSFLVSGSVHEVQCTGCHGAGTMPCKKCGATGRRTCTKCGGGKQAKSTAETCKTCLGQGQITCDKCKGQTSIRCEECQGSGTLTEYTDVEVNNKHVVKQKDVNPFSSSLVKKLLPPARLTLEFSGDTHDLSDATSISVTVRKEIQDFLQSNLLIDSGRIRRNKVNLYSLPMFKVLYQSGDREKQFHVIGPDLEIEKPFDYTELTSHLVESFAIGLAVYVATWMLLLPLAQIAY